MRKCELCDFPANLYCESDEANLCWKCDTKVHSANFLAAKHTRTLICHVCKSTTSLHVSGSRFGPGTSICHGCIIRRCRLRNDGIPKMGETHREEECSSNFCSNNIGEEDEEEKIGKYKSKFCQREKRKKSAKLGSKSQVCIYFIFIFFLFGNIRTLHGLYI